MLHTQTTATLTRIRGKIGVASAIERTLISVTTHTPMEIQGETKVSPTARDTKPFIMLATESVHSNDVPKEGDR